jgi:hypothetical protein
MARGFKRAMLEQCAQQRGMIERGMKILDTDTGPRRGGMII